MVGRAAGRALAALLASLAAAGLLTACASEQPRNSSGQLTAPATTDTFSVRVGDCLGKLETDTTAKLPLVPCSEEHHWEAFAASELTGDDFPGNSVLGDRADEFCRGAFADFVGVKPSKSRYELTSLLPTRQTWTQAGDRELICLVGRPSGGITGTLKGVAK